MMYRRTYRVEVEEAMTDREQPDHRQARRDAILAARDSVGSLPQYRREVLQAQFESASSQAQRHAKYVRP